MIHIGKFQHRKDIVHIDGRDLETSGAKKSDDLFDTIEDFSGAAFVFDTSTATAGFQDATDAIERKDALKFDGDRLDEKVWCTLDV